MHCGEAERLAGPHLAQLFQEHGDARQPLHHPLVVPVPQHQLHQLQVPGTHSLLKHWGWGEEAKSQVRTLPEAPVSKPRVRI